MDTPARYIAQALDPNALAIRDTLHDKLYMLYVTLANAPNANYQITIVQITQSPHPFFMFEHECFSTLIYCARDSVLQATVRVMLAYMHDDFEMSAPSELAVLIGGTLNNQKFRLPPRRRPAN